MISLDRLYVYRSRTAADKFLLNDTPGDWKAVRCFKN